MKCTVEPHDLEGACASLGVTLSWLSEETGIPVVELELFAKGEHALLARDRFAILARLAELAPAVEYETTPLASLKALFASRVLMSDVREEERAEDAEESDSS